MLTTEQKTQFFEDGYIFLPSAISPEMVENALHHIYHHIGQGIPPEDLPRWTAHGFFPGLDAQSAITDLFNASILSQTVRELMGPENVTPMKRGQLALRFPREPGTEPKAPGAHIDGIYTPHNGVTKGTLASFSALAGVFLTDVTQEYSGNLTLWPGSHRKMESYFQEHGIQELLEGRGPNITGIEPRQITARAGDAVIAHYQLLHGITINVAPLPRFATFFRIKHPQHEEHRLDCLTNLWREWPAIQEIAAKHQA